MIPSEQSPPASASAITRQQSPVYTTSELEGEFRQGEIISDLIQYTYRSLIGAADQTEHRYVIILSQDCDLLREFTVRGKPATERPLNGVLLFEMLPTLEMFSKVNAASAFRKTIRENKNERYHLLEEVPQSADLCGRGLPEMLIDFRRYFTIPSDEMAVQCSLLAPGNAKRRCRLEMPYREHLQCRAVFYMQRVMLPLEHGKCEVPKSLPPA